jgi:hypothetical protein
MPTAHLTGPIYKRAIGLHDRVIDLQAALKEPVQRLRIDPFPFGVDPPSQIMDAYLVVFEVRLQ